MKRLSSKFRFLCEVVIILAVALAANASPDTALLEACAQGNLNGAQDALVSGASPSCKNEDGLTPLAIALSRGHVNIARFLLEKGASAQGVTELMLATIEGNRRKVNELINANRKIVNEKDDWGGTVLEDAIQNGDYAIFKMIMDAGADINSTNRWGATPLVVAAYHDRPKMVSALLSSGAKLEVVTKDNFTALSTAAIAGNVESVKVLLDAGAKIDIKDCEGLYLIERIKRDISALKDPKYQKEREKLESIYKLLTNRKSKLGRQKKREKGSVP